MAKKKSSQTVTATEQVYDRAVIAKLMEKALETQCEYEQALRNLEKELGGVELDSDITETLDTYDADSLIEEVKKKQ